MPTQTKRLSVVLGLCLVTSLLTAVVITLPRQLTDGAYAEQRLQSDEARAKLETAFDLSQSFRMVAETMRPSVVSVQTKTAATSGRGRGGMGGLPPQFRNQLPRGFEDFFGPGFEMPRRDSMPAQPRTGQGSGVVIRADGYILTNNHVLEGADEVIVQLSDDREVIAEVIGTDPETDLAVIKVDAGRLQPVALGSSEDIQVGDWVLAIGSPFGLDQTVTAGIISGKNRRQGIVAGGNGFEDFLQTDAAINPGNSGGPLVNLRGELVGINTAILSRSGGNAGIGFAIPVAMARPVFEAIIENGEVRRGFLGAAVADVNAATSEQFGLKATRGALIQSVLDGQPAAKAGLQPGDVVTKIDGQEISSGTDLVNTIASRQPGAGVSMTVDRDGETINVDVKLQERNSDVMAMFREGGSTGGGSGPFGLELEPITPENASKYGLDDVREGLLVTSVDGDSVAGQAGLQAGDVIEKVGGQPAGDIKSFNEAMSAAREDSKPLRLIVRRGTSSQLIVVTFK